MKLTLFVLLNLLQVSAQTSDSSDRIESNIRAYRQLKSDGGLLEGKVFVSKDSYLPGEEVELTVSIRNPSDRSLRVIDPLRVGPLLVVYSRNDVAQDSAPIEVGMMPVPGMLPIDPSSITTFSPGETRTAVFRSSGLEKFGQAPERPGTYSLVYHSRWSVEFKVRDAKVDVYVEAALPPERKALLRTPPSNLSRPMVQKVFSVLDSSGYSLCLQAESSIAYLESPWFKLAREEGAMLSRMVSFLGGYRCVASSQSRITDIDVSFYRDGSMLVISKREGASMLRHRFDRLNTPNP